MGEKMSISTTSSSSIVAPCHTSDGKWRTSPGRRDALFAVDGEADAAALDDRHLLVRVLVHGGDDERRRT